MYCSYICSASRRKLPEAERLRRHRLRTLIKVRRYQARRVGQMPPDADENAIRLIYANCPDGHEVDHRIPIAKGGLHHQDNLQYLPMIDNRRKGSKIADP
jgi:5-methylcytosine-specific restriction endonuclease McrA